MFYLEIHLYMCIFLSGSVHITTLCHKKKLLADTGAKGETIDLQEPSQYI